LPQTEKVRQDTVRGKPYESIKKFLSETNFAL